MQVCPKNAATNVFGEMKQVMVVVPVDPDIDKAQQIAQENRQQWRQRGEFDTVGHFQFQHHDGDDDCEHAVAERFEPVLLHAPKISIGRSLSSSNLRRPIITDWKRLFPEPECIIHEFASPICALARSIDSNFRRHYTFIFQRVQPASSNARIHADAAPL